MGRGKLLKFEDNTNSRNVIQYGKPLFQSIKGNWSEYFGNTNPLVMELACGRGEYSTGLAKEFPLKNFVGVDIKGARIWNGSQFASRNELTNVAFLRTHIQNLEDHFEDDEVSEIWIIHPDPRPKDSDERRRMTNNRFLDMYKKLISPGGIIRFKTDNTVLYEFTLETLRGRSDVLIDDHTDDLYQSDMHLEHHGIITKYEDEFTSDGHMIKSIKFSFEDHK